MIDPVVEAVAAHPRADFLPAASRHLAGYDGPLPIGHGSTNSQPRTVTAMLALLEVREGDHILDVGSGSGWTTALLAHLTGPTGRVVGVEIEPAMVSFGARNLAAAEQPWAEIHLAPPGVLGDPSQAPYDRILVSAEADVLPEDLVAQLAPNGVMVIPVAGAMLRVVRTGRSDPDVQITEHGTYRFVPLR